MPREAHSLASPSDDERNQEPAIHYFHDTLSMYTLCHRTLSTVNAGVQTDATTSVYDVELIHLDLQRFGVTIAYI